MCGIRKFRCQTLDALLPYSSNLEEPVHTDIEGSNFYPTDPQSEVARVDISPLTMAPLSQPPSDSNSNERIPESREAGFISKRKREKNKFSSPILTAGGEIRHFVTHNYIDRSNMSPDVLGREADFLFKKQTAGANNKRSITKRQQAFPLKLHIMLHEVEKKNLTNVVSWLPHGRAFAVHDIKRFKTEVMGKYFQQSKITSFHRQLNLYDFVRITAGLDRGAYYHEYCMRGKPHAIEYMSRTKVKGTKIRGSSSPEDEPNFYDMDPVNPPPYGVSGKHVKNDSCVNKNQTSLKRSSTDEQLALSSSLRQVSRSSSIDLSSASLGVPNSLPQDGSCPNIENCTVRSECQVLKEQQIATNIECEKSGIQKALSPQPLRAFPLTPPQTFNASRLSTDCFVSVTPKTPTPVSLPSTPSSSRGKRLNETKSDPVLDNMVSSMNWNKTSNYPNLLVHKFENWETDGDSLLGDAKHDKDFVYSLNEQPEETLMEYTCDLLMNL